MKHHGLLHPELSCLVAGLGHTQTIVIADAGLPIPAHVPRIDLAVRAGLPTVLDVLDALLEELIVEKVTTADETRRHSPDWFAQLAPRLAAQPHAELPHAQFKDLVPHATAVIRTGEVTSYANVILHGGVNFWEDPEKRA